MAIAVLGIRQRGGATGICQVIRQAGATATPVGRSFTILWRSNGGGNGFNYTVGETVNGPSGSGIVKNVGPLAGFGTGQTIFVSITSGTFNTGDSVTGVTSGAIVTMNGIGISNNDSAGAWPPEPTAGNPNCDMPQDRVIQFKDALYAAIGPFILKYDGVNDWSIIYTQTTPVNPTSIGHCHTGLHVLYVNNQPLLGYVYGNSFLIRTTSVDGTSWIETSLGTGFGFSTGTGSLREIVWNNVLYLHSSWNDGSNGVFSWDPSSDAVARTATVNVFAADLIIFQNQLIMLTQRSNTHAGLQSLLTGVWTDVLDFGDTGPITGGGFYHTQTAWAMWTTNDGFLYCAYAAFTNPQLGWVVKKVQYSGGNFTDLGQIQATVLAGTGIPLYPGGPDVTGSRIYAVIDNISTPGAPDTYLYYSPVVTPGSQITVLKFNGPTLAVTNLGQGGDIANALANTRQGGGERIWGPGQPDIIITNVSSVSSGVRFSYIGYGGGTNSIQFWYGQTGQPPLNQCTLASPSVGTLSNANHQIDSVPMDGVTVHQVTWMSIADGAINLSRAQIEPIAF